MFFLGDPVSNRMKMAKTRYTMGKMKPYFSHFCVLACTNPSYCWENDENVIIRSNLNRKMILVRILVRVLVRILVRVVVKTII